MTNEIYVIQYLSSRYPKEMMHTAQLRLSSLSASSIFHLQSQMYTMEPEMVYMEYLKEIFDYQHNPLYSVT